MKFTVNADDIRILPSVFRTIHSKIRSDQLTMVRIVFGLSLNADVSSQ